MHWSKKVFPFCQFLNSALRIRPPIPGTFLPREVPEGGMTVDGIYVPGGVCSQLDITNLRRS